jgi:hypothetical protein
MAKSKHTIGDIQKALMTHTRFIKETETVMEPEVTPTPAPTSSKGNNDITIDPMILKKFRILSRYLNEPAEGMINKALEHFLRLKGQQLDQAIQKITEEE